MTTPCHTHADHSHRHAAGCGHTAVHHEGHIDYLHDGHLHHQTAAGVVEEHAIAISATNPSQCSGGHACSSHAPTHVHGPGCGHEAVPHGDHIDYLVDGHLHHPHNGHCDNHGPLHKV